MKAIIFTFEGVFCDTRAADKWATKTALKEFGYFWNEDLGSLYEKNDRKPEWVEAAVRKNLIRREDVLGIRLSYRAAFSDAMSELNIVESVYKRLNDIKCKTGVAFALVGKYADRKTLLNFLRQTRLNELFDYVTSSEDAKDDSVHAKTLGKMLLKSEEVVCVESSTGTSHMPHVIEIDHPSQLERALNQLEKMIK